MAVIDARSARRLVTWALAAYVGGLAFMLLVPWGSIPSRVVNRLTLIASDLGVPAVLLDPSRVEFVANVLVLIPPVAAAAWLWPAVRWTEWTAYGFVVSISVEAVQALLLPDRTATYVDIVANTAGALIGSLAGWAVLRRASGGVSPHEFDR